MRICVYAYRTAPHRTAPPHRRRAHARTHQKIVNCTSSFCISDHGAVLQIEILVAVFAQEITGSFCRRNLKGNFEK
jgi:hypothetical protein